MMGRLIGVGVASLVVVLMAGVTFLMRAPAQNAEPPDRGTSRLARALTRAAVDRAPTPRIGWVVTKATSAEHMMVVDVEAERIDEARGIAVQIVEPVRSHGYDEILIYVRQPGRRDAAVRRVQWTPRGGYVVTAYSDR
jgi:hypothetical protein